MSWIPYDECQIIIDDEGTTCGNRTGHGSMICQLHKRISPRVPLGREAHQARLL